MAAAASVADMASGFANSTVSASIAETLYPGMDLAQLSLIEQIWAKWYIWMENPSLATGVLSFCIHEFTYFGRCVPWMIIDMLPYFRKYKLQPEKVPTAKQQWDCTKYVLYTHFTIELPQIWFFHPIAEYFGMSMHQVPLPSWTKILAQIALFFVLEDTWHYWTHRLMHSYTPLYKHVHKLHHQYSAPFGLAAEYAHPIEVAFLGTGTVGGPILWCLVSGGDLHIFTMYLWIVCRLFQAVDAHSGYDFPWSLHHWFPLWAGADHHDFHHANFIGCYSSSLRWWDHFLGTDNSYKAYKNKIKAAKQKAGNQSDEQSIRAAINDSWEVNKSE